MFGQGSKRTDEAVAHRSRVERIRPWLDQLRQLRDDVCQKDPGALLLLGGVQTPHEVSGGPRSEAGEKTDEDREDEMKDNQTEKTVAEVNPRWIRIRDAVRVSGICRSSIYELINSGAVKSFSHKKEGKTLGQRLISYQSLIDYLDAAYEASKKEVQG